MSDDITHIDKILELGPKAMAKAYQDIMKKIKEGTILSPAEVKTFGLLEKNLQEISQPKDDLNIVDSMEKVARHFKKSLRQVQRWARAGMPVLPDGTYSLGQIEVWLQLNKRGRGPAAAFDPRQRAFGEATSEGKDYQEERLKKAKADLAEMEVKQRQAELVRRQDIEDLFVARIIDLKQRLLTHARSLPPQLIHCPSEREMEIVILAAVRELLLSFARPLPEALGGIAVDLEQLSVVPE